MHDCDHSDLPESRGFSVSLRDGDWDHILIGLALVCFQQIATDVAVYMLATELAVYWTWPKSLGLCDKVFG